MTAAAEDDHFERTMRLVCRLDDNDIDYVRNTGEWIRRCIAEAIVRNPALTEAELTPTVLDMSLRGRYRLMKPETVATQLALPMTQPGDL